MPIIWCGCHARAYCFEGDVLPRLRLRIGRCFECLTADILVDLNFDGHWRQHRSWGKVSADLSDRASRNGQLMTRTGYAQLMTRAGPNSQMWFEAIAGSRKDMMAFCRAANGSASGSGRSVAAAGHWSACAGGRQKWRMAPIQRIG
jgi:hypothetical protein